MALSVTSRGELEDKLQCKYNDISRLRGQHDMVSTRTWPQKEQPRRQWHRDAKE